MAFIVKPFREIISMSKEKLDEALAPIRARSARAKADLEIAKLDEKLVGVETEIHKLCAEKELDFNKISDKLDEYALAERRRDQITGLIKQLFPEE